MMPCTEWDIVQPLKIMFLKTYRHMHNIVLNGEIIQMCT